MSCSSRTFASPRRDQRKSHDCHCGGKCSSCASKSARREQQADAREAMYDYYGNLIRQRPLMEGEGETVCNQKKGELETKVRPACKTDVAEKHEAAHVVHRKPCCARYGKAWNAAKTDAERQAAFDAYDNWMTDTMKWSECQVSTPEVEFLTKYINLNCEGGGDDVKIGAGIGAGLGAIGGGIGGAFAGQALAEGSSEFSALGGGALGGVLGAIGGGLIGAGLGALTGYIVREIRRDNVDEWCCTQLKETQLQIALDNVKASCPGEWRDCPFDADGKIVAGGAK